MDKLSPSCFLVMSVWSIFREYFCIIVRVRLPPNTNFDPLLIMTLFQVYSVHDNLHFSQIKIKYFAKCIHTATKPKTTYSILARLQFCELSIFTHAQFVHFLFLLCPF